MTVAELPTLPNWPEPPDDVAAATREIKAALRRRIEAGGRTVDEVVTAMLDRLRPEIDEVVARRDRGEPVWPEIDYADIAAGTVTAEQIAKIHRRGCLVVRGNFARQQALDWDGEIVDYVERNHFFEHYRGPGDDFFSSVDSKPEIYPVYWSPSQLAARRHDRMQTVQRFLNRLWRWHSGGHDWFDPDVQLAYPDRIRRRPPGADSGGLGTHVDTGTIDLWMTADGQAMFRRLFAGEIDRFDPWDAAHRTAGAQYEGTTMCSAFRTFQGWTALSDMDHDQGVLRTVPITAAIGYLLLRPLLADVADDDLCGVARNQAFPVNDTWHGDVLAALSGLPDVRAGDTVWWHCDLVHGVAPVTNQRGWGNVMYIPAAPRCRRNDRYRVAVDAAFATRSSPPDFPAEHYERDWT